MISSGGVNTIAKSVTPVSWIVPVPIQGASSAGWSRTTSSVSVSNTLKDVGVPVLGCVRSMTASVAARSCCCRK